MTGINKRSSVPGSGQKKLTRYGTTHDQEVRDSNKLMEPMFKARRDYEAKKKRK
jgi:hypothetical protein